RRVARGEGDQVLGLSAAQGGELARERDPLAEERARVSGFQRGPFPGGSQHQACFLFCFLPAAGWLVAGGLFAPAAGLAAAAGVPAAAGLPTPSRLCLRASAKLKVAGRSSSWTITGVCPAILDFTSSVRAVW